MMTLSRDRDQIGSDQRGHSHQLCASIASAADSFHPNRLAFRDLGRKVEECMFDSLTLYESRALIALFNDRRRKAGVNEYHTPTGVSQICGEVGRLSAGISKIGGDHDSARQSR